MKIDKKTIKAYRSLTKPRIAIMVLVSTAIGFFLAHQSLAPLDVLFFTLFGTYLSVAGAATLNNFLERDIDKKMARTASRALPSGLVSPAGALAFGTTLTLIGTAILVLKVNLLTGFLALLSSFLYVLVYTPLKRITWWNTVIGAIPGALPPVGGWAAATGEFSVEAGILFLILFIWQHPHFYAIAWMYRDEYRQAGFQMLPSIDPDGSKTAQHVMFFSLILMPVSVLPAVMGESGIVYGLGACLLSLYMLIAGIRFITTWEHAAAKGLLRASIIYLPLILMLVIADASVL